MKSLKIKITAFFIACAFNTYAQHNENTSKETVTKIIRVKGANGKEEVIKKEQVIIKKSALKLNPEDEGKTNQNAIYTPEVVAIENSDTSSSQRGYTMIPDGKGYTITFIDETGTKVAKAKLLSNGYYIVNNGDKDNSLGHLDKDKNMVIEAYDSKTDLVMTKIYKAN